MKISILPLLVSTCLSVVGSACRTAEVPGVEETTPQRRVDSQEQPAGVMSSTPTTPGDHLREIAAGAVLIEVTGSSLGQGMQLEERMVDGVLHTTLHPLESEHPTVWTEGKRFSGALFVPDLKSQRYAMDSGHTYRADASGRDSDAIAELTGLLGKGERIVVVARRDRLDTNRYFVRYAYAATADRLKVEGEWLRPADLLRGPPPGEASSVWVIAENPPQIPDPYDPPAEPNPDRNRRRPSAAR